MASRSCPRESRPFSIRRPEALRGNSIGCAPPAWFCFFVCLFILVSPSYGNFMVKPMLIELTGRPGQRLQTPFELLNATDEKTIQKVDLELVGLSQKEDGTWKIIEPVSDSNTSKNPFSCLDWLKLSATYVEMGSKARTPMTLEAKVPPRASGFYYAAIVAKKRLESGQKGVGVTIQFLVPVLIDIHSRVGRQDIKLNDVGLEFVPQTADGPATTLITMAISNPGKAYSRLMGNAVLKSFSKGHWLTVTKTDFRRVGILPNVNLNLKNNIERALPSKKYKLEGYLFVDGRRIKPLEKEIDFAGDTSITTLAADAALELEPSEIFITGTPGAARSGVLKIHNASDADVNIVVTPEIPPALRGAVTGELKGEELTCAKWVKIMPDKFTLRGGARQNIRIITDMPKAESIHANYYSRLNLRATYPDGKNAGEVAGLLCVKNKKVDSKALGQIITMTLAETDEPSHYAVAVKITNAGNIHINPACNAAIITDEGKTVAKIPLIGLTNLMLPMEFRDFSNILDFSGLSEGTYHLWVNFEYARNDVVSNELPLKVSVGADGKRIIEIIKSEKDAGT